ncbi:hypothetical protein [Glutamicibacter ardleyensis]|uniref:hypothetical protein n=1 Tax=Glutamicibacter ardleyensis TaxID=225894 RepID=UPI003FD4DE74
MKNVSTASTTTLATKTTVHPLATTNPLISEMRRSLTEYCICMGLNPADESFQLLPILDEAYDFATIAEKPVFIWLLNLPVLMLHDSFLNLWASVNAEYMATDTTNLIAKLIVLELAISGSDDDAPNIP